MATTAASVAGRSDVAGVFPGQGAQRVGMGRRRAAASPAAAEVFATADRVLGFALTDLVFEGSDGQL